MKKEHIQSDARNVGIKLKQLEGLSNHTIDGYEKFWNDMDRFFDEKMDVADLTVNDARDFIHWQLHEITPFLKNPNRSNDSKKGISINSANTYLTYAKTSFKILEQEGITTNIFQQLIIKKLSNPLLTISNYTMAVMELKTRTSIPPSLIMAI